MGQVTLERKSTSSYGVKFLFYYSSNGGIRLYIDGCQTTGTGARLGRETMRDCQMGARCGPGLANDSELMSNKLSSIKLLVMRVGPIRPIRPCA